MGSLPHATMHQAAYHGHVRIVGHPLSAFSNQLLRELGAEARLPVVQVTSVLRSVPDQAHIFYTKHVVEGKVAKYKNPDVAKIIARARQMRDQRRHQDEIEAFLITGIEHAHGGPASVSNHLGVHIFTEVFDIAHYSGPTKGAGRHNAMTDEQAKAFLAGCRERMPSIISRLGHSVELGFELPGEFPDEKCFHFEVKHPLYDKLELPSATSFA